MKCLLHKPQTSCSVCIQYQCMHAPKTNSGLKSTENLSLWRWVVGFSKLLCQGVMSSPVQVPNHLIIHCSWNSTIYRNVAAHSPSCLEGGLNLPHLIPRLILYVEGKRLVHWRIQTNCFWQLKQGASNQIAEQNHAAAWLSKVWWQSYRKQGVIGLLKSRFVSYVSVGRWPTQ